VKEAAAKEGEEEKEDERGEVEENERKKNYLPNKQVIRTEIKRKGHHRIVRRGQWVKNP